MVSDKALDDIVNARMLVELTRLGEALSSACSKIALTKKLIGVDRGSNADGASRKYFNSFKYKVDITGKFVGVVIYNDSGRLKVQGLETGNKPRGGGKIKPKTAKALRFKNKQGKWVFTKEVSPHIGYQVFKEAYLLVKRTRPTLFTYIDFISYSDGSKRTYFRNF